MDLIVYLFFNGNSKEAMNFYKNALDGSINFMQRYGESPVPSAEEQKNKIMHASMTLCGRTVMFSDSDGKRHINFGDNFSLSIDCKSVDEIRKAYEAISAGGQVTMPLQDTFWGATFGMCTDKFGVNWMFNYDHPKP